MASRRTVVVLTYHGITPKPSAPPAKYRRAKYDFEMDMELIAKLGYETISFGDLVAAVSGEEPLQNDAVIITFDDGLISQYEAALPILVQLGLRATFFVCPGLMGTAEYFFKQETIEDILCKMLPTGEWQFDVESHGYDHVDLKDLSEADRDVQLWAARRSWDEMFAVRRINAIDRDVVFAERRDPVLALPYGGTNTPAMQSAASAAGYKVVRTAIGGVIDFWDASTKNLLNVPSYLLHENSDLKALLDRRSSWPNSTPKRK